MKFIFEIRLYKKVLEVIIFIKISESILLLEFGIIFYRDNFQAKAKANLIYMNMKILYFLFYKNQYSAISFNHNLIFFPNRKFPKNHFHLPILKQLVHAIPHHKALFELFFISNINYY